MINCCNCYRTDGKRNDCYYHIQAMTATLSLEYAAIVVSVLYRMLTEKAGAIEAPAFRLINRVFNIRRKLHIGYSRKISDALSLLYSGVKYILHFKIQRGSNCLHTPYNTYRYLWPNSPYASLSTQSLASDRTYKPTCEVLTVILRTRSIDFNLSILYSSSCFPSDFP